MVVVGLKPDVADVGGRKSRSNNPALAPAPAPGPPLDVDLLVVLAPVATTAASSGCRCVMRADGAAVGRLPGTGGAGPVVVAVVVEVGCRSVRSPPSRSNVGVGVGLDEVACGGAADVVYGGG